MKETDLAGRNPQIHRALLYPLIILAVAFGAYLALTANPESASLESFKKGEKFSVRKAMVSIFGNVDEHNKSSFESDKTKAMFDRIAGCHGVKSFTATAVEWKAFTLDNVETVFLATSAVPLDGQGEKVCLAVPPVYGMHIFEKKDDCWTLSASINHLAEAGYDGDAVVDFVKIGPNQVALAINDGVSKETETVRWTYLYSVMDDQINMVLLQSVYRDNQGNCSMEGGPGEVWTDFDDIADKPDEELATLTGTCHSFKTEIYVIPSDLKFYNLKAITTDTLEWKGSDGVRLTPRSLEYTFVFENDRYACCLSSPATGPMVPLFDEASNYKKRRQSLEKRVWGVQ